MFYFTKQAIYFSLWKDKNFISPLFFKAFPQKERTFLLPEKKIKYFLFFLFTSPVHVIEFRRC